MGVHVPIHARTLSERTRLYVPVEGLFPILDNTGDASITEISTGLTVWHGAPVYSPRLWRWSKYSYAEEAVLPGRGFASFVGVGISHIHAESVTSGADNALGGFVHAGFWKGLSRFEGRAGMLGVELRYTFAPDLVFSGGDSWSMNGPQLLLSIVTTPH